MALYWIFALAFASRLVSASPASPLPACGGHSCYSILGWPLMRDVAKDFGSYYPHYPKKTSVGPVTNIESITVSGLTSITGDPITTPPAPMDECPLQRGLRGSYDTKNPRYLARPSSIGSSDECASYCATLKERDNPTGPLPGKSYTWASSTEPGTPNGPGICLCWARRLCDVYDKPFAYGSDFER